MKGALSVLINARIPCKQNDVGLIQSRRKQCAKTIQKARARGDHGHARPTRELRIAIGHKDSGSFMTAMQDLEAFRKASVIDGHDLIAR